MEHLSSGMEHQDQHQEQIQVQEQLQVQWRRDKVKEQRIQPKRDITDIATAYNDIFEAFRLALKFYHFE